MTKLHKIITAFLIILCSFMLIMSLFGFAKPTLFSLSLAWLTSTFAAFALLGTEKLVEIKDDIIKTQEQIIAIHKKSIDMLSSTEGDK